MWTSDWGMRIGVRVRAAFVQFMIQAKLGHMVQWYRNRSEPKWHVLMLQSRFDTDRLAHPCDNICSL